MAKQTRYRCLRCKNKVDNLALATLPQQEKGYNYALKLEMLIGVTPFMALKVLDGTLMRNCIAQLVYKSCY